jgi:SCP-2 sterol transfer family
MAEFLSDAWIAELDRAARAAPDLATAPDAIPVVVEQHVRCADETEIAYHFVFDPGGARVHAGPAEAPDLVFLTDEDTARALARGSLNAQQAAGAGRLKLRGHAERLRDAGELLRAARDVFQSVREATTDRPAGSSGDQTRH